MRLYWGLRSFYEVNRSDLLRILISCSECVLHGLYLLNFLLNHINFSHKAIYSLVDSIVRSDDFSEDFQVHAFHTLCVVVFCLDELFLCAKSSELLLEVSVLGFLLDLHLLTYIQFLSELIDNS